MPFSDFNYILPSELPTYIRTMASVTNEALAARFISDAERVVDAYVGPAPRFYSDMSGLLGSLVASGATTWPAEVFGMERPDYWARGGVYIRVVSGAGTSSQNGQRRLVVGSTGGQVTLASGFDAALGAGTEFAYEQESAFPRVWDTDVWAQPRMPFELKAAVAAQVEYGIQAGSEAFGLGDPDLVTDEDGDITSRTYSSGYSESRDARRRTGIAVFLAPRARVILQRLLSSTGYLGQ